METNGTGALAAALAKAQSSFPAIPREKEVTVQTKNGGSYKFKYAPLDSILTAVRGPLADNGLAVSQLLDSDPDGLPFLVSKLLHKDGGVIEGRTPIPHADGETVQAFGSAITYLRRYALQALLGIAAEEDDDGNSASGNSATFRERNPRAGAADHEAPPEPQPADGSLIGVASVGKAPSDFELRATPKGQVLSFRLTQGRKSIKVVAYDTIAEALALNKSEVVDQRVQCWGVVSDETFTPKGTTKEIAYQVLTLHKIQTSAFTLPDGPSEPDSLPLFDPETEAELEKAAEAA